MSRNRYLSITPGCLAASHPIDGMVELCLPTVTPRGREDAAGMAPDRSAGVHRNIARQSREHRQLAATQRMPEPSAPALIP
jgi:hypothetical protein